MNYLKSLKSRVVGDNSESKIAEILPVSSEPFECKPNECVNGFKESCFSLRSDAAATPLYETAEPSSLHFLVSTGTTDWEHDAFEQKGTILNTFNSKANNLARSSNITIKSNVTNEPLNISDPQSITLNKLDVLILPWFVWIRGITKDNIDEVFTKIKQILQSEKNDDTVKGNQAENLISKLTNVEGLVVTKDPNMSVILLCSHRTRDKKCGITAPIMKKEFDSQLRDLELYRDSGDDRPGGVKVIFVNHVGGHKFAANVLIYNKHGEFVWFARCTPLNVKFILNETVQHHKVFPANVRACSTFNAVKW
ncbi:hypothetical protein PICMEDRAFT_71538 [Pichia membranifaciens NRRL Y-2026]|uniref:Actin patches distal protein 1 n=1 Tax=Pichia membranifaciens NRRL Y-2026 TaxID=763406 RepID=A0A1E3NMZ2_9ASCO|nr:hypothetical protein PICMEDRAFT_71538 [Pichia membranifaciens NRRL Y-2026]ODQ47466.1 hypothetical protein PICMEDRAFT_71538 [Pichia membranifaciens NRRL Y-2026]